MKPLIIGIVIIAFLIELFFLLVRLLRLTKPVSLEANGLYDENALNRANAYHREVLRVRLVITVALYILYLVSHVFDIVFKIHNSLIHRTGEIYLADALTALIMGIVFLTPTLVDRIIRNFVIDNRYSINKTSFKAFFLGLFLKVVLGGALLFTFVLTISSKIPLLVGITFVLLILSSTISVIMMVRSLKPMEESRLKEMIDEYATRHKFPLKKIFVKKVSKRTTRANAFFQGAGKRRKIVLYDTLVNTFTDEEVLSVFAHEMGHAKNKDTLKILPLVILLVIAFSIPVVLLTRSVAVASAFGFNEPNIALTLVVLLSIYKMVVFLSGLILNPVIRHFESKADRFSALTTSKLGMIGSLKRLALTNIVDPNPHPIDVFVNYSHPPIMQRIQAINRLST